MVTLNPKPYPSVLTKEKNSLTWVERLHSQHPAARLVVCRTHSCCTTGRAGVVEGRGAQAGVGVCGLQVCLDSSCCLGGCVIRGCVIRGWQQGFCRAAAQTASRRKGTIMAYYARCVATIHPHYSADPCLQLAGGITMNRTSTPTASSNCLIDQLYCTPACAI